MLQEVASQVLTDVAPEFASISAVLGKVGEFKRWFPPQYSSAYMSESLPALLSVYVRLQLLSWDPLFHGGEVAVGQTAVAGQAFMEHAWFKQLMDFSSGVLTSGAEAPARLLIRSGFSVPCACLSAMFWVVDEHKCGRWRMIHLIDARWSY